MPALIFAADGNQQYPYLLLFEMRGLFPQPTISILFTVVLNSGDRKYQQVYELFYRKETH